MMMPLTLRLAYHGLRGASLALLIAIAGWLIFVPATAAERVALGVEAGGGRPLGLVQMRAARAMLHFAPDRSAQLLSHVSRGELSPELAGMILRQLAAGPAPDAAAPDQTGPGGSKFVKARP